MGILKSAWRWIFGSSKPLIGIETFESVGLDDSKRLYPCTALVIEKANALTHEQRVVEARFAYEIDSKLDAYIAQYRREFKNVLNTDDARTLCAQYNRNMAVCSAAVQEPASALVGEVYHKMLTETHPTNRVVFLAGGPGSGKTFVRSKLDAVGNLIANSQIIYDTTFASENAARKVVAAINADEQVLITYIHRPFEQAVAGVIDRAVRSGRIVPLQVVARSHFSAQRMLWEVQKRHSDAVSISVIANPGGESEIRIEGIDFLKERRYDDLAALEKQAHEIYQREHDRRKGTLGAIPAGIDQALRGDFTKR